jgi:hypothetical protein
MTPGLSGISSVLLWPHLGAGAGGLISPRTMVQTRLHRQWSQVLPS